MVLANHAYAGAVIGAVRSAKVAALAPAEGESAADVFYRGEAHQLAPKLASDGNRLIYLPDAAFAGAFAQNATGGDRAVLMAVQRPIAPARITAAVPRPLWLDIPSRYLVAEQDRMISPANQRFMTERMCAWVEAHAVDDTPIVTAPGAVTTVLREAVAAVG